jgi:hypothetical protein
MNEYLKRMFYENNTKDKNYFLIGVVFLLFSPIIIPLGIVWFLYKCIEELGWVISGGIKP